MYANNEYCCLILLGRTSKSICTGLEVAFRNQRSGCSTFALVTMGRQYTLRTSLRFKKFIASYNGDGTTIQFCRRRKIRSLLDALRLVISYKRFRMLPLYRGIDVVKIVLAALSAKSGAEQFDLLSFKVYEWWKVLFQSINSIDLAFKFVPIGNKFVAFNGREVDEAGFIAVARLLGKQVELLERGSSNNKFETYFSSPHNNLEWWAKIDSYSRNPSFGTDYDCKETDRYLAQKSVGFDPFENRAWRELMRSSPTRESLRSLGRYVIFFSVSSGEVSPFDDFMPSVGFRSQFDAFVSLKQACIESGLSLVLRRHPNSIGTDGIDREQSLWMKLVAKEDSVVYIEPTSQLDSYGLAKGAMAVFTWRSTIGVDTIVLGVPSFAMGPAKWARNEAVQAFNQAQLRKRLQQPGAAHLYSAREFGAYMSHFGRHFESLKEVDRWGVTTSFGRINFQSFHRVRSASRFLASKISKRISLMN